MAMFWFMITIAGFLDTVFIKETSADFFPITATQSGNYNPPTNALLAVDGDPSTCSVAAENNVTIRESGSVYGWLQVDLGNPFLVISVTLTNTRTSAYEAAYLQNFTVLVSKTNTTDVQSSTTCYTYNTGSEVGSGIQIALTCNPNPLIGRYITIKRQGGFRQDAISLCEVTVTHQPSDGFVYLYNLPTNQIGAYGGWNSSFAVDLDTQTCAQPMAVGESQQGWWSIDLQSVYTISQIIIYNSNSGSGWTQYASQYEVRVGPSTDRSSQTLCYNFTSSIPAGGNVTLNCYQPLIGQFLSITRWSTDNTKALNLCEVYIKGDILRSGLSSTTSTSTITTTTSTTSTTTTSTTTATTSVSSTSKTSTVSSSSSTSSASTSSTSAAVSSSPSSSSGSTSSSIAAYFSSSASTRSEIAWSASTTAERSSNSSSFPSVAMTAQQNNDSSELDHLKAQNGGLTIAVIVLGAILGLTIIAIILYIIIVICRRRKMSRMKMLRRAEKRTPVEPDSAAARTTETAIDPPKTDNDYQIFKSFNRETLFYANDDDLMSETTDKATDRDTRRHTAGDTRYANEDEMKTERTNKYTKKNRTDEPIYDDPDK